MKLNKIQSCVACFIISLFLIIPIKAQWNGTGTSGAIWRLGNVGIGFPNLPTPTLSSNLHIISKSPLWDAILVDGTTWNYRAGISLKSGTGQQATLTFNDGANSKWQIGKQTDNGFFIYDAVRVRNTIWISPLNGDLIIQNPSGNVGIGTGSPQFKLDLNGQLRIGPFGSGANGILFQSTTNLSPFATWFNGTQKFSIRSDNTKFYIGTGDASGFSELFTITNGGSLGIGTTNPTHKLSVNGTIRAKEIIVNTGWSDFVFEDDYDLMTLSELEIFIKQNGHLPEIPTTAEIEADGVELGNMQSKLLLKIEELTLYMIELKKENELLQGQMKRINELLSY